MNREMKEAFEKFGRSLPPEKHYHDFKGLFEAVAEHMWNAATERGAKIADSYIGDDGDHATEVGRLIRTESILYPASEEKAGVAK